MHHGELPGVVQLEAGNPPAVAKNRRLGELAQLTAVNECLQDVLLDVVVVVDHGRHSLAQLRKVHDIFVDAVVIDVIGSGFGSQQQMIANILFDEAISVMTADHRVGKMDIFDHGL